MPPVDGRGNKNIRSWATAWEPLMMFNRRTLFWKSCDCTEMTRLHGIERAHCAFRATATKYLLGGFTVYINHKFCLPPFILAGIYCYWQIEDYLSMARALRAAMAPINSSLALRAPWTSMYQHLGNWIAPPLWNTPRVLCLSPVFFTG